MLRPVSSQAPKAPVVDIVLDVLGRNSRISKLPVVNDPRAIGREMGDPALLHQADQNIRRAVFDQVRPVNKHDRRAAPPRPDDVAGAMPDLRQVMLMARPGRCSGIDQNILQPRLAFALGQRKNLQFRQIDGRHCHAGNCAAAWQTFARQ